MHHRVVALRAISPIIRILILVVFCSLWAIVSAYAETIEVYPGEYVVELGTGVYTQGVATAASAAVPERDLGGGAKLFRRQGAAGSMGIQSSGPVPLDPSDNFCAELVKQHAVKSCSPNYRMHATAVPNDPRLGELWGMSADKGIDAPRAWDVSTGSKSVVVAIIDTGADYRHKDLAANIWTNSGEVAGNGIDDDHNGVVDDVHGFNAVANSGDPMDDNEHGTHVAGTIGARGNNRLGVVGVNWNVKIMPLKFLAADGSGSLAGAIQAINYMVAMKTRGVNIRVANNSWGGGGYSDALYHAISRANDAGIIFVAAAGNESNNNDASPSYPADYDVPNVVSVAAVDSNRNMAYFSNYGAAVDIAAPGVNILSTTPKNRYAKLSGTSMATPHVTGALALLLGYEPALGVTDAIRRLYESGLPVETLNNVTGTGRMLNVGRMLHGDRLALPTPTPTPAPCTYSAEQIAWNPDTTVDNTPIVQQADEFGFYEIDLPFIFPFHGQDVTQVFVSPNGVLYAKRAPSGMDYENSTAAPLNAISALQSDLVASGDPYGVRIVSDSDHATVYWKVKHWNRRTLGDIDIHLSIYADGRIEEFLSFGDADIGAYAAERSTIGLTGPSAKSAYTYAYNSAAVASGVAIRYTGVCSAASQAPSISSISLHGYERGRQTQRVRAGRELRAVFSGQGTGSVEFGASWNGRQCPGSAQVALTDGTASISMHVPRVPARYTSLQITSEGVQGTIKVSSAAATKRRGKSRRARLKDFNAFCDQLLGNATPI